MPNEHDPVMVAFIRELKEFEILEDHYHREQLFLAIDRVIQARIAQAQDAAREKPGVMHASNFDVALDDRIRSLEREMHVLMGRSPAPPQLPIGHGG